MDAHRQPYCLSCQRFVEPKITCTVAHTGDIVVHRTCPVCHGTLTTAPRGG